MQAIFRANSATQCKDSCVAQHGAEQIESGCLADLHRGKSDAFVQALESFPAGTDFW